MGEVTTTTGAQAAIWPEVIQAIADGRRIHRRLSCATTELARQRAAYCGETEVTTTTGAACANCHDMQCLTTGRPCSSVEAILRSGTNERRSVDAQPWGDISDLERYHARRRRFTPGVDHTAE